MPFQLGELQGANLNLDCSKLDFLWPYLDILADSYWNGYVTAQEQFKHTEVADSLENS